MIANNGIAAVKCMRSIRRWCYEVFKNERAIKFAAMITPEVINSKRLKMIIYKLSDSLSIFKDLKANAGNASWKRKRRENYLD